VRGLAHILRAQNFCQSNKLPGEDSLAKCSQHFSPPTLSRSEIKASHAQRNQLKKPLLKVVILVGRDKTTTVEPMLKALYEVVVTYPETQSSLDRTKLLLRNAVKPDSIRELEFLV